MAKRYFKIEPTRERHSPDNVVQYLGALHSIDDSNRSPGTIAGVKESLFGENVEIPRFEFLMITEGKQSPVEFYFTTDDKYLSIVENRLKTTYPPSFTIKEVELNRTKKLVHPMKFTPEQFIDGLNDNILLVDPDDILDANASPTDLLNSSAGTEDYQRQQRNPTISDTPQPSRGNNHANTPQRSNGGESNTTPAPLPTELDSQLLSKLNPPAELNSDLPLTKIDGPTLTEEGDILARPSLSYCKPVVVHWNGKGERKRDWMTTLNFYTSDVKREDEQEIPGRSPLAPLVDFLTKSPFPLAFQVVFERMKPWEKKAKKRKIDIHKRRDTLGEKIVDDIGRLVHGSSKEYRRERRRDPFDDIGESSKRGESRSSGQLTDRRQQIDDKDPTRTFRANIRAVAVARAEKEADIVEDQLAELSKLTSHIDGPYYHVQPEIIRDEDSGYFSGTPRATAELERFLRHEIVTGNGKVRPDIVLNPQELANFIAVPSYEELTVEGARGARASPQSRDPLPRPNPDMMKYFHQPGMRVGYALDQRENPEEQATQVPPSLLPTHYGRFATTGGGKSKALINDVLSLYENTNGPTILIDPKGDGMPENYLKTHFQQYGEKSLREDVIYFPLPEVLPGFTFFDIRPALEAGVRRVDAVQNIADKYEEIVQLTMEKGQYQESKVAPVIIKALIKTLFDKKYGKKQYHGTEIKEQRESSDFYSHNDLEHAAEQMRLYVETYDHEEPQGKLPETEDGRIKRVFQRYISSDPRGFAQVMDAVFNRLDKIREDTHLRRIFDNTEQQLNFEDYLNEDKVIIFDLGGMREESTRVMSGLIMSSLMDALKQHSREKCTLGHDHIDECSQYAKQRNEHPDYPPCRVDWDDNHVVNLIIDESASVAVSNIMNNMLEKGRGFHLSVGLSMQYPGQMKSVGDRAYQNVLNNIGTFLVGKIKLDQDIAEVMAHENMSVDDYRNRISALPRGEWVAQLPSPEFAVDGPEPFSLSPLPIPAGHPESDNPLTDSQSRYFDRLLNEQILEHAKDTHAVPETSYETSGGNSSNTPIGSSQDSTEDESESDSEGYYEHNYRFDQEETTPNNQSQQKRQEHDTNGYDKQQGDPQDGNQDNGQNQDTSAQRGKNQPLPDHIIKLTETDYQCERCGQQYHGETGRQNASKCCLNRDGHNEDSTTTNEHSEEIEVTPSKSQPSGTSGRDNPEGQENTTQQGNAQGNSEGDTSLVAGNHSEQAQTQTEVSQDRSDSSQQIPEETDQHSGSQESTDTTTPQASTDSSQSSDSDFPPQAQRHTTPLEQPGGRIHDEGKNGHPTKPVGKSDYYGPLGSYEENHVDETVPITSPGDFEDAILVWTRSSVVSLGVQIRRQLKHRRFRDTQKKLLNDLVEQAANKGVKFDHTTPLKPAHINDALCNRVDSTAHEIKIDAIVTYYENEATDSQPSHNQSQESQNDSQNEVGMSIETPTKAHTKPNTVSSSGSSSKTTSSQIQYNPRDIISPTTKNSYQIERSPLTKRQLQFIQSILDMMNNEKDIPRYTSLWRFKNYFQQNGVDIETLKQEGYITEHRIGRNAITYTVENKGKSEIEDKVRTGEGIGDRGDGMPHRFGADLAIEWLERNPQIDDVRSFVSLGEEESKVVDVVGFKKEDGEYKVHTIVEIEGGRNKKEVQEYRRGQRQSEGTHDYDSLAGDHAVMAAIGKQKSGVTADYRAVWVARSIDGLERVFRGLDSKGCLNFSVDEAIKKAKDSGIDAMNEFLQEQNNPGVTHAYSFESLKKRL